MKNNQKISIRGGHREGSGRKPGVSKITMLKHQLKDFISDEVLGEIVALAVKMAQEGHKDMLRYVLDQCLGKSMQKVIVESPEVSQEADEYSKELVEEAERIIKKRIMGYN